MGRYQHQQDIRTGTKRLLGHRISQPKNRSTSGEGTEGTTMPLTAPLLTRGMESLMIQFIHANSLVSMFRGSGIESANESYTQHNSIVISIESQYDTAIKLYRLLGLGTGSL